ncbi:MAG: hypothetical protein KF892_25005 [Rhizobacter sp.]|nr:hypothetical protein [Rhizobacter sp.]
MELPRIPDLAAKQTIDSTRLFREYTRVRRELVALEGSLFWKPIGEYEYLAHKVKGTTHYKGVRSPATEAQITEFKAKKLRLKERYKRLKESVETSQRMNKAVHAGTVPTEIIEMLGELEEHGLSQNSLVVGPPALYAYGQSSGVNLAGVTMDGQRRSLLPRHPECVHLLVQRSASPKVDFKTMMKKISHVDKVEVSSPSNSRWVGLHVFFSHTSQKDKAPSQEAGKLRLKISTRARTSPDKVPEAMSHAEWLTRHESLTKWLDHAPPFEQVVVGRTGKMAVMRTLDPKAYVTVLKRTCDTMPHSAPTDEAALSLRVVEKMIDDSMIVTKLDDASQRELDSKIRAWASIVGCDETAADGGQLHVKQPIPL